MIADAIVNSVQCGNAAFLLKQLPSESVDLVVTSPPYWHQRCYNHARLTIGQEKTVDNYVDSLMDVFDEIARVIRPTGSIVYNIGDKYHNGSLLLVPWRFAHEVLTRYNMRMVNQITWVKSNPTPRQFNRRLVNSTEPFFHFAPAANYFYDCARFMNEPSDARVSKPGPRLGSRYRTLIKSSSLSKDKKQKALEALDEVVDEVKSGTIHGFRMKIKGIHAEAFGGNGGGRKSQMDRQGFTIIRMYGRRLKRDVIDNPVETIPQIGHSAIFPLRVIRELVRLLCPPGGIVLDPYMGSGTTAMAAYAEGCRYVGMEIEPEFCSLAQERISKFKRQELEAIQ